MKWAWLILGMLIGAGLMHVVFYYGLGPKGRKAVEDLCDEDEGWPDKAQEEGRDYKFTQMRKPIDVHGYFDFKYEPEEPASNLHGSHSWQRIGDLLHSGLYKGEPLFGVSSGKEEKPIDPFLRTFADTSAITLTHGDGFWTVHVPVHDLLINIHIDTGLELNRPRDIRCMDPLPDTDLKREDMYLDKVTEIVKAVEASTGIKLELWNSAWSLYRPSINFRYYGEWSILVNGEDYKCIMEFSIDK